MDAADKHYKIINSKTGYAIYYFSLSSNLEADVTKIEIDKIKAHVAIKNRLNKETIYWEEIKDND